MRKLMLMASMLAMVLLAASPAMAQTGGSGGDAADDSTGGAGGDAVDNSTSAQYNTQLCQNIVGDIDVANDNTAGQYAGDDTAVGGDQSGDGNDQELSQDEAQAVAQQNNTTINIVQQCFNQAQQAQGEDIAQGQAGQNVVDGDEDENIGPAAEDNNGDGVVDMGDDVNGDGVVGQADTVEADTNNDGVVGEAEAQAVASASAEAGAVAGAEAEDAEAGAVAGAEAEDAEAGSIAVLPDTGGASLFTLGAGALLVAGGLLARRIVR